jgi:integrase
MVRKRKTYQKGILGFHRGIWTLRWREYNFAIRSWSERRQKLEGCTDPKNKKKAREIADEIMKEVNQRNNTQPSFQDVFTFDKFVKKVWRPNLLSEKKALSTIDNYDSVFDKHLSPKLGKLPLREITPGIIGELFIELKSKFQPRYLNKIYAVAASIFSLAVDFKYIEDTPLRNNRNRAKVIKNEKPVLTREELLAIFEHLRQPYRLFCILLYVTGLRVTECTGLMRENFDPETGELQITHDMYRQQIDPLKSEAGRRTIILHPMLVEAIKAHMAQSKFRRPEDFIFTNSHGRPLHEGFVRDEILYPAMDAAGIKRQKHKFGWHIFRHTAATGAHAKSRDLKVVQGMLGHANYQTTELYVHKTPGNVGDITSILFTDLVEGTGLESKLIN